MKKWSKSWKSSKNPRKQRKYLYNLPLHIRKSLLSATLSKDLRKKYGKRSLSVRKDDKVKVLRGQFKKKTGKITRVNMKKIRIYIEGVENVKKDGSKAPYPVHPSNVMITELNLDDKERKIILERNKKGEK
ncbi:MAG: 50S ribosomal protein L24 [Nanoarchaeota archaeon]|jgi:large subunit ribosomal protein L24|nr:50S ribosomal protein L24 [Nanoarchaeota archaeon]